MSDHLHGIGFDSRYESNLASPEVRRAFANLGTPFAVAAENLCVALQDSDPREFDLMIATNHPAPWKRMNRRLRRMLRRG